MDSSQLNLTIDVQNNRLVSVGGTPTQLLNFFQSNTKSLRIQCVSPSNNPNSPATTQTFTVLDMNGYGMRVAVGDTPEGDVGPTPLALQDTMVWDAVNKWFTGQLPLNTSGIDGFLGSAAARPAYFEVNLTINSTRTTILQMTFTLFAVVDELTGTVPTPTDKFLTAVETQAQFVPRQMENGATIVIPSPSGVYALEVGCNDDGTAKMNVINL